MGRITSLQSLGLDITKPLVMKDAEIELRKLNVMTGYNGAGKSFINVSAFALTTLGSMILGGARDENLKMSAQYVIDTCFDSKEITGLISAKFDNDALIRVILEEGNVVFVYFDGFQDVTEMVPVKYMSAAMRTFNAIKSYLVARKMILKTVGGDINQMVAILLEDFKLYDVMYIESLVMKMPLVADEKVKSFLDSFELKTTVDVLSFGVDLEKSEFYLIEKKDNDEKTTYLSQMSAGNQSIYNLMLANI